MTAIAAPARACLAFDSDSDFTPAQADELWSYGYRAALLYVPLPDLNAGRGDASAAKLAMLLAKGWQVGWVQHPRNPNWRPADHDAAVDATVACTAALGCGFPPGIHGWLDLEGPAAGTTADDTQEFAETWAANVRRVGYLAGCYVGYGLPLGSQRLYLLHGITSYWSDMGHRSVMSRGCSIHQGPSRTIAGLLLDPNTISPDLMGDMPMMAQAGPVVAAAA